MRPDPALGVFETMLVRRGQVIQLRAHLDRLARSAGALYGMRLPADLPRRVADEAAGVTGEHRLRVDVIPGDPSPAVTRRPVGAGARRPVTLEPLVVPGGLGEHKWRDRRRLEARPAHPVPLLVDQDGTVLEGAWGNLWILEDGGLVTPPTDGRILPGVTRALLLERAGGLGLSAREETVDLARLRHATTSFLTSAIRLAVPAGLAGAPAPPAAPVDRIRAALA